MVYSTLHVCLANLSVIALQSWMYNDEKLNEFLFAILPLFLPGSWIRYRFFWSKEIVLQESIITRKKNLGIGFSDSMLLFIVWVCFVSAMMNDGSERATIPSLHLSFSKKSSVRKIFFILLLNQQKTLKRCSLDVF